MDSWFKHQGHVWLLFWTSVCIYFYRFRYQKILHILDGMLGDYIFILDNLKGAKAPVIPFKNKNNSSGHLCLFHSLSFSLSLSLYVILTLSIFPSFSLFLSFSLSPSNLLSL